ncbi:hypothetical protein MGWOODY_Mmi1521 [hydrothermal vent metagenome]|uniref:Uncharacterized protein n=1 Tax=hydrothermal vent metagenome TaxID=652676 RepID=A0A160VIV1_9ZZZZ
MVVGLLNRFDTFADNVFYGSFRMVFRISFYSYGHNFLRTGNSPMAHYVEIP